MLADTKIIEQKRLELLVHIEQSVWEYLHLKTGQGNDEDSETESENIKDGVNAMLGTAEAFLAAKRKTSSPLDKGE